MLAATARRGITRAHLHRRSRHEPRVAHMQDIEQPTMTSGAVAELVSAASPAEEWAKEPFLRPDEEAAVVLAEGTARRRALEDALAEMAAGHDEPSNGWRVRYGLMLGLERILSARPPALASGTELRRHQVDALAGMLTELIAANQEPSDVDGNGLPPVSEHEDEDDLAGPDALDEGEEDELPPLDDPGAVRRFRFRHPTASGK